MKTLAYCVAVGASFGALCGCSSAGGAPEAAPDDSGTGSDVATLPLDAGGTPDVAMLDQGSSESSHASDAASPEAAPPAPTREQVLSVKLTFQGLSVTLPTYGTIPWFEPAISSLDAASRQIVYQAKHAAGDTHIGIAISWAYMNDGNYSYPVPGKDLTGDLPAFRALVAEAIANGFIPVLFLAGDGESTGDGGYNDPNGWSYGYDWLAAHLPQIVGALQQPPDLTPRCIVLPGWDGVTPRLAARADRRIPHASAVAPPEGIRRPRDRRGSG